MNKRHIRIPPHQIIGRENLAKTPLAVSLVEIIAPSAPIMGSKAFVSVPMYARSVEPSERTAIKISENVMTVVDTNRRSFLIRPGDEVLFVCSKNAYI